jgi:hypothetical protein
MVREQRRPRAEIGDERAISAAVPYQSSAERANAMRPWIKAKYNMTPFSPQAAHPLAKAEQPSWQRQVASLVGATPILYEASSGIWNTSRPSIKPWKRK